MAKVDEGMIHKALAWSYDKALDPGVPGVDSAYDLAKDYSRTDAPLGHRIDSLIRWQNTKAATSGFITGLGGILTLPVAIPANISSVLFVQVRMITAIAIMCGLDPRQDQVKTLVFVCLCGSEAKEILKHVGIQIGKKLTEQVIRRISFEVIKQINKAVGFRLVTKFGQTGLINLGKSIPILGGVIGGLFDLFSTEAIGRIAKETFT